MLSHEDAEDVHILYSSKILREKTSHEFCSFSTILCMPPLPYNWFSILPEFSTTHFVFSYTNSTMNKTCHVSSHTHTSNRANLPTPPTTPGNQMCIYTLSCKLPIYTSYTLVHNAERLVYWGDRRASVYIRKN